MVTMFTMSWLLQTTLSRRLRRSPAIFLRLNGRASSAGDSGQRPG
jgi:hypothetical protein